MSSSPAGPQWAVCDAERGGAALCSAAQLSEALGSCAYWGDPQALSSAKVGLESAVVALALALAAFHLWQIFQGFRDWTLFYYTLVVAAQYLISLTATGAVPVALYVPCTAPVNWLRYAAWLLILPAMVIALCRVTGLSSVYPRLQDPLILLSILMVILGVSTAAAADVTTKGVLFALAGVAGLGAFAYAVIQFIELYYTLNIVGCRRGTYPLAALWCIVWVGYPVLFIAGPEGFGSLSAPASAIAYAFVDLVKLSWGLCAWNLRQNCRRYARKYGTVSKKVALPFGLGTVAVRTFYNENDVEEAETDSPMTGLNELEEVEATEVAAVPEATKVADGPRESDGQKRRNGNRLSLDVKERIQGISRRTSQSSTGRVSVESGRNSVESDPGAIKADGTAYRRAGRLSVDMKRRLDALSTRTSCESAPDRTSTSSARPRMGSRLSTDMSARLAVIEQKRQSGESERSNRRASVESSRSAGEAEGGGISQKNLPWDAPVPSSAPATDDAVVVPVKSLPKRVSSDNALQLGGIGIRRSFQKSRRNSGEDAREGDNADVDKDESLVDCGPSPMPSGLVRVLVASKDPDLLETIKHQLHSFSAELPIKVQEATSLEELSRIASTVAKNMRKPVDVALVHSSMVMSPGCKTLKVEKNVPVVAFGVQEAAGERGPDYNDWLDAADSYKPGETDAFDPLELLRILSYWQHRSERRRSSNS